jgi:hypothetical protein
MPPAFTVKKLASSLKTIYQTIHKIRVVCLGRLEMLLLVDLVVVPLVSSVCLCLTPASYYIFSGGRGGYKCCQHTSSSLFFCHCCGYSTVASGTDSSGLLEFAIIFATVLYVTGACFASSGCASQLNACRTATIHQQYHLNMFFNEQNHQCMHSHLQQ